MEESNQTPNNEKLKYALCYVPIVAAVFFFTEKKKSEDFMKHIKYGNVLFGVYLILYIIIGGLIPGILSLLYVGIVAFLGYKTYNGEDVEIEYIDKFEAKVKDSFETNDSKKK